MPREFDPEILLTRPLMANLATTEQGAPRNAPVWFLWENGALWAPIGASSARRLRADPRCAVEIVDFDRDAGILLHLGLRGSASIEPQSPDRFRRLLAKYLGPEPGWNPWFITHVARPDDPDGLMVRLVPDSVFTNNVSYFHSGPDLAWPPRL